MRTPIVLALPAKNPASTLQNQSNPSSKFTLQKQSCKSMPLKTQKFESISFEDPKKQRLKTIPRTLQILFKKVSQSRKRPSWEVLRGKERRKNIKQIMQTLECRAVIIPYSAEQFQSFKNALAEHGQEDDMDVITEPPNTSTAQITGFQEKGFHSGSDFGSNYGNSDFIDLEKEYEYENLVMRRSGCKNRGFDDLMQFSSVEEVLNEFSKEKLF